MSVYDLATRLTARALQASQPMRREQHDEDTEIDRPEPIEHDEEWDTVGGES